MFAVVIVACGSGSSGSAPQSTGAATSTTAQAAGSVASLVIPAPSGFVPSQTGSGATGPMTASSFDQFVGSPGASTSLQFIAGYQATYDGAHSSDSVEVTVLRFSAAADAQNFSAGFSVGGTVEWRADRSIPGARDFDSTSPTNGTFDHAVVGTKGSMAFLLDYLNGSAAPVPNLEAFARQQYAALQ